MESSTGFYIVIGSAGMLGTDLMEILQESGLTAVGLDVGEVDIRSEDSIWKALARFDPGVIINLAALTDVDGCETRQEEAFSVNAQGPENLARAAARRGDFFVQLSTDYVFDGLSRVPYKEDDPMNPLGMYGKSKARGELLVRELLPDNHCIVRTSWLYGTHGKNFVEAIIDAAQKRPVLNVVNDQRGCPTYTMDLARAVLGLAEMRTRGTFHVTNSGEVTWYDFAVRIVERTGFSHVRVEPTTTEQLSRPAPRPGYSVLDNSRFVELAGKPLRSWEQALNDYLATRGRKGTP